MFNKLHALFYMQPHFITQCCENKCSYTELVFSTHNLISYSELHVLTRECNVITHNYMLLHIITRTYTKYM